jgi:hypothetical protein
MRMAVFGLAFVVNVMVFLGLAAVFKPDPIPSQGEVALLAVGLAFLAVITPYFHDLMCKALAAHEQPDTGSVCLEDASTIIRLAEAEQG